MALYTISELAQLAGVSVRTLHHYDHIGLLQPAGRSQGGYRLYQHAQLYQLQQILLFKELDFTLPQIRQMLSDPDFDLRTSLRQQQQWICERQQQLTQLQQTLTRTLASLEHDEMTTKTELFNGFSDKALREEAVARWGDEASQSHQRWDAKSTPDQQALQAQGATLAQQFAALRHLPADAPEVQQLAKAQHQWLNAFSPCPAARLPMLGEMYVHDERFKAFYDRFGVSTAEFVRDALVVYAAQP